MINTTQKCNICKCIIPQERLEALMLLEINPFNYTCFNCSLQTVKPIKGIYTSFSGASPMIIADSVGNENGIYRESE